MKTASCKNKGRLHQQNIAKKITEFFQLEEGDVISRSMGSSGIDIITSPRARKLFPLAIEAKATTVTPGTSALEQAKYNAKDLIPAVVWKPRGVNSSKSRVIMELDDLFRIIEYYMNNKHESQ